MAVVVWALILLTAAAVVGGVAWTVTRRGGAHPSASSIRLAAPTPLVAPDLAGLLAFDRSAFQARMSEVYRQVRRARSVGRLDCLEPYVAVDLLAAWGAGASGRASPSPIEAAVDSLEATIVDAGHGAGYEHVTVQLDERYNPTAMQFWTFERGRGGAAQGRACPACGAPLSVDPEGHCASCGATVDLGRPAWVLSRVESARGWSTRELEPDQYALQGLDDIAAADPNFDPDVFTERVTALYPHLAQAIRDPSCALARVAVAPPLRRRLAAARTVQGAAADGGVAADPVRVDSVAILAASHGPAGDSITVDISTTGGDRADPGRAPTGPASPRVMHHRWTFTRAAGLETRRHGGVLCEVCPSCGAPIQLDDQGRCRHCDTAATLGTEDWVLARV